MLTIISKKSLLEYGELILIFIFLVVCNQGVAEPWAEASLARMTLEEKVGQLFVIPACEFREEEHQKDLEQLIRECHVGGLILKQGTPDGQVMLINHLQEVSAFPLLCVQDGEWGLQMRMADILSFPKNLTLGAIQDNRLLYRLGQEIGWQCALVGGHINTAPVVDVNTNPTNPVIHWRSFGEDPLIVAEKGLQIMLGMQSMGVLACAKHFPGHGDAAVDSHLDLPRVLQTRERLEKVELLPFRKLIEGGVKTVMSAHVCVPALDGYFNRPATFSPEIIHDLLCSSLHFEGLVISDALNMQAIGRYFDDARTAEHAFNAGHDLLLYGDHLAPQIDRILREQVPVAFRHLVRQFQLGELDSKELDRRVLKILKAKESLNLHRERMLSYDLHLPEMINRKEAFALKRLLFREAVTLLKNQNGLLPLHSELKGVLLVEQGNVGFFRDQLAQGLQFDTHLFNEVERTDLDLEIRGRSLVIFALSELMLSKELFGIKPAVLESMKRCEKERIPFVVVVFGTPYSLGVLPVGDGMLVAYERDKDAQESAADVILGKVEPHGRLPISVYPEYPVGSGIDFFSSMEVANALFK